MCILYDGLFTGEPMPSRPSIVVTLRVPRDLDRSIAREARRRRRTKSALVREILETALGAGAPAADPAQEARRQSLLVSGRASERDALEFVEGAADRRGWR
jgi:ribbon-helix-helix CopG family protein/antidote-toxin recognition MazE-like antitoxin